MCRHLRPVLFLSRRGKDEKRCSIKVRLSMFCPFLTLSLPSKQQGGQKIWKMYAFCNLMRRKPLKDCKAVYPTLHCSGPGAKPPRGQVQDGFAERIRVWMPVPVPPAYASRDDI